MQYPAMIRPPADVTWLLVPAVSTTGWSAEDRDQVIIICLQDAAKLGNELECFCFKHGSPWIYLDVVKPENCKP